MSARSTTHRSYLTPAGRRSGPGLLARIAALHAVWVERRTLAAMEAHRLRDIGLGAADASREAARPIWDAPERWRRR